MSKANQGRTAALSALTGLALVASVTAVPAAYAAKGETTPPESPSAENAQASTSVPARTLVTDSVVEGTFAYTQGVPTPNDTIKKTFRNAALALCDNAATPLEAANPLGWKLSVSGDVENGFSAFVSELAQENSVQKVMTCTCGGNPAGGRATMTGDVKGIPIEYLLARAEASSDANTITFVSSDGTRTAMPLGYVIGHHAVLSYQINGEDLSASVGGNNQLWMTKTPANYLIRDVVSIEVSSQENPPAAPGASDTHPNSPNVGILSGTQDSV